MKSQSPPVVFLVRAEKALFTRHDLRVERFTYPVPTFGALAGVLRSIYAKPAFYWVPRRAFIVNPIRYQNIMVNEVKGGSITRCPFVSSERRMQKMQTYLYDVRYVVEAHFEWSGKQPEDENLGKHIDVFCRSLKAGGRRDVFLGTRECSAIVEPINRKSAVIDAELQFDAYRDIMRSNGNCLSLNVGFIFHSWHWGAGLNGSDVPLFFDAKVDKGELMYPHPSDPKRIIAQSFEREVPQ